MIIAKMANYLQDGSPYSPFKILMIRRFIMSQVSTI